MFIHDLRESLFDKDLTERLIILKLYAQIVCFAYIAVLILNVKT